MGLASASAKYRHKEESSIKWEVFSLSLSDLCTKRLISCCWSSYEDLGPRRSKFRCWSEGNWHGKYLNCHFRKREVSKINENWDIYSILSLLAAFRFSLIKSHVSKLSLLINLRGGSRIFSRGGALVSCSTSTPINHIVFFWQNTGCIRKPQVISGGGGGVSTTAPSP